jgi:hypothetical protein
MIYAPINLNVSGAKTYMTEKHVPLLLTTKVKLKAKWLRMTKK